MTFSEYRAAVVKGVEEQYGREVWFTGVCCDSIKCSYESFKFVGEAIELAAVDTFAWDGPAHDVE